VNDSLKDAQELLDLAKGMKAFVNLIPYNRVAGLPYEASLPETSKAFVRRLEEGGMNATLRRERGGDIDAACGQLRARQIEAEEGG
jgi:23S rRNA (adenine2503-C2)-methyltransferase